MQLKNQILSLQDKSISSLVLKACIFATGLAGIVAEYVMSTLASYLLGNTVLQWTLIVSFMLFAMGIGSRLSKFIKNDILDSFIFIEFSLSIFCAISAVFTYFLTAYTQSIAPVIYLFSISIGILIGLEIPLATRLNNYFEELRVNISSVMEKDYYGALLGGLLFAFIALPYLGLTYTPIILGAVNFTVACILFIKFYPFLNRHKLLIAGIIITPVIIVFLFVMAKPIILYGEQHKYADKIIYQEQSPYQRIVITEWKDHYWLYLNGNEQFSSYDEERYHEPLVHPAMKLAARQNQILVLGGGDGLAVREILKYQNVKKITLVDIDPAITQLGQSYPIFVRLNNGALNDPRVNIINKDAYAFLIEDNNLYDIIIIDLPDPKTVELARLYSKQFYLNVARHLSKGGTVVTQAGSPFFARDAFLSILKTMRAGGLPAIAYHNHIPTLGEWGWVLGINLPTIETDTIKEKVGQLRFSDIDSRFLNNEAMLSMLNFGKGIFDKMDDIKVNDELDLALYFYYRNGSWDMY
jgi:spermidine synthase